MTEKPAHSDVIAPSEDTQKQKIMKRNYRGLGKEAESRSKLASL